MRRKTDDYEYERHNSESNRCSYCRGSGSVDGERCPACDGTGDEPGWDDENDE